MGAHTAGDFKTQVQLQVCQAGGDLVVPQINGLGLYVRGIVYAKAPEPPATPAQ
jgi:hypothetical protein